MASKAFRRPGDSMAAPKLSRLLHSERWRPYILGSFASLPTMVVMLIVWKYCIDCAVVWWCFWTFLGGLDVFWGSPTRKLISMANFVATQVSLLITFAR
jgi:hypothetical protein